MPQHGLMMNRPPLTSGIIEHAAAQVARLPIGGTGKVQKAVLRERYGDVFS